VIDYVIILIIQNAALITCLVLFGSRFRVSICNCSDTDYVLMFIFHRTRTKETVETAAVNTSN